MAVSAAGSLSLPVAGAKAILAKSSAFQSYVCGKHGVAVSEANALKYIWIDDLFSPVQSNASLRPFVLVTTEAHFWRNIANCGAMRHVAGGGVAVGFVDTARNTATGNDPADDSEGTDDHDDSWMVFANWVGQTIDDLSEEGLIDSDNWRFNRIDLVDPPIRSEEGDKASDDFWTCWLVFSHDPGGG